MSDRRIKITNSKDVHCTLWVEPWGRDYVIKPDETFELVAKNSGADFFFQIDFGSDIKIWAEGKFEDVEVFSDDSLLVCGHGREC